MAQRKPIGDRILEAYEEKHPNFLAKLPGTKRMKMEVPEDAANKWELAYRDFLDLQKKAGVIRHYEFNRIQFWIGPSLWYKPDFFVIMPNGSIEIHEVKGLERRAGINKFKSAAGMYRWATWRMVTKKNGVWTETRVMEAS